VSKKALVYGTPLRVGDRADESCWENGAVINLKRGMAGDVQGDQGLSNFMKYSKLILCFIGGRERGRPKLRKEGRRAKEGVFADIEGAMKKLRNCVDGESGPILNQGVKSPQAA